MEPGYTIRAAQPGDVEAIVALCREHAALEGADYAPEGKATRLPATPLRYSSGLVVPGGQ